ncbi:MAG: type II toxin-antitoxin system RelE/ParE family toxin [Candidatus Bathyarchaeia archaeon]
MTYQVLLHPKSAKFLSGLAEPLRTRIKDALRELRDSPETKGERLSPSAFWRIRVGDYRGIYEIDRKDKRVIVLHIGHRGRVYDDFSRLL